MAASGKPCLRYVSVCPNRGTGTTEAQIGLPVQSKAPGTCPDIPTVAMSYKASAMAICRQ